MKQGYDLSELLTPSLCTVLSLIAKEPVATTQVIGYGLVEGESVLDRTKMNQK
jgi:hypothetical protein